MKITNRDISFIICSLTFYSLFQTISCAHDKCEIRELHHHGRTTVCLGHSPNLGKKQLDHFFDCHLGENTKILYLTSQQNLDDSHLGMLANSKQASTIVELNLMRTNVTYDGIVSLWRSKILGSIRDDEPIYERYYNMPVSVIKIEIGHTPALMQYAELLKKGKNIFPLPLSKDFGITYLDYTGGGNSGVVVGFRDIILMNHGKEIK